jgi:hypothetical protein
LAKDKAGVVSYLNRELAKHRKERP